MKRLGRLGRPLATTLALGLLATPATAQYTPQTQVYPGAPAPGYYPTAPQQATAPPAVSQTQVGVPTYTQPPRQVQAPPHHPAQQYQADPQAAAKPYPQTVAGYPATAHAGNTYHPQQGYPQAGYPTTQVPTNTYPRTAMSPYDRYVMQDESVPPAVPTPPQGANGVEQLPTPAQPPHGAPVHGPGEGYYPQHGHGYPQGGHAYPAPAPAAGAPQSYVGAGDCNCYGAEGWNTYMAAPGQYAPGCAPCADGSLAGCEVPRSRQWFFGVYGLYMQRDNPGYERFAVLIDTPGAYPYYPMPSETVLNSHGIDPDFAWGAEVRFGSTFGRSCDPCNPCAQRPYAWELVYWGLTEDDQMAMYTDMPDAGDRMYGTVNYAGLEYDRDGTGGGTWAYRPVNDYYDYNMPIEDPAVDTNDVRVLGVRVRNSFQAQNLELNFLRLPVYGCEPCSPIVVSTVCGVRFLRFDEEFQNAAMFTTVDGAGMPNANEPTDYTGFGDENWNLYHDIEVENQMVGFQMGANANWAISCKWDIFCDSMLGVYNNRIDVYQRVYGGGDGEVRFMADGRAANVNADKDDIAFMGELRAGLGYQLSGNCRLTAAYRVMAVTGVALAVEQMPSDWSNWEHVAWVDSNDSLILHGLQLGAEFKY